MIARAVAAAVAVLAAVAVWTSGLIGPLEDASVDARFALRSTPPPTGVVIVGIDERSISELGVWPFRRRLHARAVDRLREAGVRTIVYDVQFTEPSPHAADDLALYEAIGRAGGATLATGTSDDQGRTDVLGGDAALAAIASRAAAANFPADMGGMVRRYPRRIGRLPGIAVVTAALVGGRALPASAFRADATARIDFRGPPGTFPTVAFSDLIAGRVPARLLRGKVVIVGATAPTLQDRHAVPTGGDDTMSGAELQASAIWTALHGNPLRDAPRWWGLAAIALLGLAVPLASLRLRLAPTLALAVVLAVATAAAAQVAFAHGVVVALTAPLLALALSTLGTLIAGYALEGRRSRRAAERGNALELEVIARTRELQETQLEIIQRLSKAAEHRDEETGSHLKRMSRLCGELARAAGAGPAEAAEIEQASLLHDIGKIGVPDEILRKPGRLTPGERAIMQRHTTTGAALLTGSASPLVRTAEAIARTHHERWDGTGYPAGLRGEEIPRAGRIAAICDVFDALLTERPYKVAWTLEETLAYIEDERGRHFDPGLANIFLGLIRTGPPSFEAGLAAAPPARGRIASDGSPRPPAAGRRSP